MGIWLMVKLTKAQLRRFARERFRKAHRAERVYSRYLVSVAQNIQDVVESYAPRGVVKDFGALKATLDEYALILRPWAASIAKRMLSDVADRDAKSWFEMSDVLGTNLRRELRTAPIQGVMGQLLQEQVDLITSLPTEAVKRVHHLAQEAVLNSSRAGQIAREILNSGEVTVSRANLIARTEVARTASKLTEARARYIGSEGYIWRTAMDSDVRPAIGSDHFTEMNTLKRGSHRKLEGTFHKWDDPPIAGPKGERSHPGQIYNCRCWAEPVLPRVIQ